MHNNGTTNNLTTISLQLARAASTAIMAIYRCDHIDITTKPDGSPVTAADMAAHDIFAKGLAQHFPTIPLVSEEDFHPTQFPPVAGVRHGIDTPTMVDSYFLLDPVDGTREFIRKTGEFAINVGLVVAGRPVFGLIWHPPSDSGYSGGIDGVFFHRGDVATAVKPPAAVLDADGDSGEHIKTNDGNAAPLNAAPLNIVVSPSDKNPYRFEKMLQRKIDRISYRGSSLKFFSLFDGSANCYPRTAPSYEWDIAAGDALLRGLGGRLITADNGRDMTYGKKGALNGHFIATIS